MRELVIDGRRITDSAPCYVIAEIGNNHGGNLVTACQMIDAAADAGVHAVKFQRRHNATLYSQALRDKPYDHLHSFGKTYGEHRDAIELPLRDYDKLRRQASQHGLTCFATAFDERSADELQDAIRPPVWKIHSGGLTDTPLLSHIASFGKPVILSTGGGTYQDIDKAVNIVAATNRQLAILHCTASYPCDFAELNLRCIPVLRERYPDFVIGWSSHDAGIAMAVAAYTLGARIIEKHVTLSRTMKGTDHAFSLEPHGLKRLCRDLQRAHVALGDGVKRWYRSEDGPISKMRRVQTEQGMQITGDLCRSSNDLSRVS